MVYFDPLYFLFYNVNKQFSGWPKDVLAKKTSLSVGCHHACAAARLRRCNTTAEHQKGDNSLMRLCVVQHRGSPRPSIDAMPSSNTTSEMFGGDEDSGYLSARSSMDVLSRQLMANGGIDGSIYSPETLTSRQPSSKMDDEDDDSFRFSAAQRWPGMYLSTNARDELALRLSSDVSSRADPVNLSSATTEVLPSCKGVDSIPPSSVPSDDGDAKLAEAVSAAEEFPERSVSLTLDGLPEFAHLTPGVGAEKCIATDLPGSVTPT